MTKRQMYRYILLAIGLFLIGAVVLLSSCSRNVHVDKQISRVDSSAIVDAKLKISELVKEREEAYRRLRELEYSEFDFAVDSTSIWCCDTVQAWATRFITPVDTAAIIGMLPKPKPTTVIRRADGSIEIISERLRKITFSKQKLEEELRTKDTELQRQAQLIINLQTKVRQFEESKQKETKTKVLTNVLWWILLGLVLGFVAGLKTHDVMRRYSITTKQ